MTELYIFGAGGHGHDMVAMIPPHNEDYWNGIFFKGFFDDNKEIGPGKVVGTWKRNYMNNAAWRKCAIGLNWPLHRFDLVLKLKNWNYQNIISEKADLGYEPSLGEGIVIGQFSTLGYRSRIGNHVHVGANVAIHRGKIGDYTTICPGATICGDVEIGKLVTIGAGATISNLVKIGDGAFIGAGATVIKDVPEGATVAGNPARGIYDVHNTL